MVDGLEALLKMLEQDSQKERFGVQAERLMTDDVATSTPYRPCVTAPYFGHLLSDGRTLEL